MADSSIPNDLRARNTRTNKLEVLGTAKFDAGTTLDDLTVSGNATVGGTLGVTGATTLDDLSVGGTLGVTGATTLSSASLSGSITYTGTRTASVSGTQTVTLNNTKVGIVFFTAPQLDIAAGATQNFTISTNSTGTPFLVTASLLQQTGLAAGSALVITNVSFVPFTSLVITVQNIGTVGTGTAYTISISFQSYT